MVKISLGNLVGGWMLAGFVCLTAPAMAASRCAVIPERNIVDAILNQSYTNTAEAEVESVVADLDESKALIPEVDFYHGLAIWYRGYQNEDLAQKKKGINKLRQVAQLVEDKYPQSTGRNHLIVGIVKAYTARALFEDEQIVKGYYMGIDAVNRLDQFLANAKETTPGYHDAQFLMGLYSVYTHNLKTRSHWLIGTVNSVGNKKEAIRNIHKAIQSNAVFAAESARSFLAEVNWRTPEICRYRDLAEGTSEMLPNNLDLALLAQGLLLKCGHSDAAWEINNRFHSRSDLSAAVHTKMLKARLRILADQGKITEISRLELPDELETYRLLAKANAADVSASRQQAVEGYQSLLHNNFASKEIKRAATVRLDYPYKEPRQIQVSDNLSGLKVCTPA